jgi:hypothetical protein
MDGTLRRAKNGLLSPELRKRLCMAVLTIAPVVPLLLMINLVARHGVDIPFADEWTLAPLFVKAQEHKITFMDLFMQWHEHRMVLPKLIFIACTVWAGGNMRIEMFLSVLLAAGSAINLLLILRRSSLPPAKLLLVATLMNLLVFSPVQVESWTWGVQLTVFLVSYLLTTGICIASSRLSIGKKFVACAVISGELLIWKRDALVGTNLSGGFCWP